MRNGLCWCWLATLLDEIARIIDLIYNYEVVHSSASCPMACASPPLQGPLAFSLAIFFALDHALDAFLQDELVSDIRHVSRSLLSIVHSWAT
jgi:hypothetical protein